MWQMRKILGRTGIATAAMLMAAVVSGGQSSAQTAAERATQDTKSLQAESERKVDELERSINALKRNSETARALEEAQRVLESATAAVEDSKRVAGEAKRAAAAAPKAPSVVPGPPASYPEQEDGLERLRRNQRELTQQRIGDILILRGN
jgi:hypothetical protein